MCTGPLSSKGSTGVETRAAPASGNGNNSPAGGALLGAINAAYVVVGLAVMGAILGALIMQSLQSGMILLNIATPMQPVVIGLVLLHSGRGGGLSDMFGGGIGTSAAGSTVMERNLDRITVAIAVGFAFTTVIA